MRILVTGAFGNRGIAALEDLLARGHRVRAFDRPSWRNRRKSREFGDRVEVVWGDIRSAQDLSRAIEEQERVIHLAFIIPSISSTGLSSETWPGRARSINVDGTTTLIRCLEESSGSPHLLFTSSLHVYGRTMDRRPPRTVEDPVQPVDHYARHKVECEALVRRSSLSWSIFRLAAALPLRLSQSIFHVPLTNRIEVLHRRDAALALASGIESNEIWGRTWLIGGGPACRHTYGEMLQRALDDLGIRMLPESAFTSTPYSTDWLDTEASQRLLAYQTRTFEQHLAELKKVIGWRAPAIRAFAPAARLWLILRSPYWWRRKLLGRRLARGSE